MEKEVKLAKNKLIFRAFSNPEALGKRKEKELSTVVDISISSVHFNVLLGQFCLKF